MCEERRLDEWKEEVNGTEEQDRGVESCGISRNEIISRGELM